MDPGKSTLKGKTQTNRGGQERKDSRDREARRSRKTGEPARPVSEFFNRNPYLKTMKPGAGRAPAIREVTGRTRLDRGAPGRLRWANGRDETQNFEKN